MGGLERPEVDSITGLSPVIAIEQKTVNKNPRSTVNDHRDLRLSKTSICQGRKSLFLSYRQRNATFLQRPNHRTYP